MIMTIMQNQPNNPKQPAPQDVANELLANAMKQPGIKEAMEAFESSEKYQRAAASYQNYVTWDRLPPVVTSSHSTDPA